MKTKVIITDCPECESYIRFHNEPVLGQFFSCPECDERLEVTQTNPLKLSWAYEDYDPDYEEDWDDEDWDDAD